MRILSVIILWLSSVSLLSTYAQEEIVDIVYSDSFLDIGSNMYPQNKIILPKSERLNAHAGKIEMVFAENCPDSIQICCRSAASIWESVIQCSKVKIGIEIIYSDSGADIETHVITRYNSTSKLYYPTCLYKYINNIEDESDDATVKINLNRAWNCSHSDYAPGGSRNMTYAMLRAIGLTLGFGSTIIERTTSRGTVIGTNARNGYSIFDSMISNGDGKCLTSISITPNRVNTELNSFVQSGDLYVVTTVDKYRLYAPSIFEQGKSLQYIDDTTSLMHFDPYVGDVIQRIDSVTIDILQHVGWKFKPTAMNVEIYGQDIPETGICSAYRSHVFAYTSTGGLITNQKWTYKLPLLDGSEQIVKTDINTSTFEIPALVDVAKYETNINGDIFGEIILECELNGEYVTDTYRVSLGKAPIIKNVTITNMKKNDGYDSYDVSYVVEYYGTESLETILEVEYYTGLRIENVKEPFYAHVTTKSVTCGLYAWIDIKANNEYGEDIYTIELTPTSLDDYLDVNDSDIALDTGILPIYKVYNSDGVLFDCTDSLDDMLQSLSKGLYIIHTCLDGTIINVNKYIKQ